MRTKEVRNPKFAEKITDAAYEAPIDFWDDHEELHKLVVAVTHKVVKKYYVDKMLYIESIDELLQVGWEALLSSKALDGEMSKSRMVGRMKRFIQHHLLVQVMNLSPVWVCPEGSTSRTQKKMKRVCLSGWMLAHRTMGHYSDAYDFEGLVEERMDMDAGQLTYCSQNPERVLIAREKAAEKAARDAEETFVESDFLLHQIGDGLDTADLYDGTYVGMEEALTVLLCAMHWRFGQSWSLKVETKRRYAQGLVSRMQGKSNVEIAAEQGRKRMQVGSDIGRAKQGLAQWYSLSRAEQVDALESVYAEYPELAEGG